jgi:hypothetical protein
MKNTEIQSSLDSAGPHLSACDNVMKATEIQSPSVGDNSQNACDNLMKLVNPTDMMKQNRVVQRRSERLKEDILLTIEDKVNMMTKKWNIEGNPQTSSNSFSVLDDKVIVIRVNKMGAHVNPNAFDTINMLRDLEAARTALNEKAKVNLQQDQAQTQNVNDVEDDISENNLICFIQEEESDFDDFILVIPKRKRKYVKRLSISVPRK